MVQPPLSGPTMSFFSTRGVGEEGLAERRTARDQLDRPRLDTRLMHVDQDEADALVLARRVGAHQAEAPVGQMRARFGQHVCESAADALRRSSDEEGATGDEIVHKCSKTLAADFAAQAHSSIMRCLHLQLPRAMDASSGGTAPGSSFSMSHSMADTSSRHTRRAIIASLVLGFCLAFAQFGATVHELGHSVEAANAHHDSDSPSGHDELCIKCLSFAHVGHSIGTLAIHFLAPSYSFATPTAEAVRPRLAELQLAYLSTGPPIIS